jgi:UDP-N-acetyl-D-mannosaminuronic acid transferase (WecB/TagA/CpsF family)
MPSTDDTETNFRWLVRQGFDLSNDAAYVAPMYPRQGPISDPSLVDLIDARRPKLVVIALSGGVQERLGWELRKRLAYRPTILCIGGAIAFLSGRQTQIPVWADRLALGWLFRFISDPGGFSAKVRGVESLASLVWKYRSGSVTGS